MRSLSRAGYSFFTDGTSPKRHRKLLTEWAASNRLYGVGKVIGILIETLSRFKGLDRTRLRKEGKELSYFLGRQVFNQIPGVSAVAALFAGGWVASTFTTSPFRAALARWGLMKGGTHVVSSHMYRFLSVVLPILAAAVTAYTVNKILKVIREQQMQKNMIRVSHLGEEIQSLVNDKLAILERAKEAGLLSAGEYLTKKANLYNTYSRTPSSQIKELLLGKLGG